jgi:pyridinium-3,5-bisthiocarboxylic acid mononucleotide nickel chelatase
MLGVTAVYCTTISLGDGFVTAAHGLLPVPAPATLRLLEGLAVRPGPEGSGELVTPTGAALVRVLSGGPPVGEYVVVRSGYGAGTKEFTGRANALRLVLAEPRNHTDLAVEHLVQLACDIDDMSPEYLAAAAERLRDAGSLDVVLIPTVMKKGRPGTRLEVLCDPAMAEALQAVMLAQTTTLGIRRTAVERRALPRETIEVVVDGHTIRVKIATLPGGSRRAKPEFGDVERVALATGGDSRDIFLRAAAQAERA